MAILAWIRFLKMRRSVTRTIHETGLCGERGSIACKTLFTSFRWFIFLFLLLFAIASSWSFFQWKYFAEDPPNHSQSCNCDISSFFWVVGEIGHLSICGQVNAMCFDNFITNLQDTPIDKGNANVTLDPEAEVKVWVLFRLFYDNMRKGCPKIEILHFFF